MPMFQLKFLRWLIVVMINFKWRGRRATDLDVAGETVPVGDGEAIKVRIYTPRQRGSGPLPVLHFFHGGGWIGFNLDTHDPLCRDLCVQSGHLVVSFDYRLAPEHPFPVPVQDCLATLAWTKANAGRLGGDAQHIVIGGDSAGGNLAAVVAQQARTLHPGLVKRQLLIYPVTDDGRVAKWPSYKSKGGRKFALTHSKMCQLWDYYTRGSTVWTAGMTAHDLATPLHVKDLARLPPALVLLAEDDLLHDEGAEYARRMQAAGNEVCVKRYPGQQHGFVGLQPTAAHRQAVADMATWLKSSITGGDRSEWKRA